MKPIAMVERVEQRRHGEHGPYNRPGGSRYFLKGIGCLVRKGRRVRLAKTA